MDEVLARICWNSNGWEKPSGPEGKSKNKDAYEVIVGYGHEEWLFDLEKTIDGYHYAFLQGANAGRNPHRGKVLKVHLYTINSADNTRWWVGEIDNLVMVDESESESVYQTYKELGWFDDMLGQISAAGGKSEDLENLDPKIFVTVKFKIGDVALENPPKQFSASDAAIPATYYNFQKFEAKPKFINTAFEFVPGHNPGEDRGWMAYTDHESEKDLLHNRIQNSAYVQLCETFGDQCVGTEQLTANGTRIDIVVKKGKSDFTFYEIKTATSALAAVRQALPQLLEYAYFPSQDEASKLVVISPVKLTPQVEEYLTTLRRRFRLPIYYQEFDVNEYVLSDTLR